MNVTVGDVALRHTFVPPAIVAVGKGFTIIVAVSEGAILLMQAELELSLTDNKLYTKVPAAAVGALNTTLLAVPTEDMV